MCGQAGKNIEIIWIEIRVYATSKEPVDYWVRLMFSCFPPEQQRGLIIQQDVGEMRRKLLKRLFALMYEDVL